MKPRARSADRFSATVERRGASRPYLPRDVVDGQVEVGAEHLEGEALGLASAAFLRGRGRMMSVPALESGRVARRGGRRARRGARSPNRRKHFPRGSRFSRGVPEKADRMDAPRTRRNDRGERDSRRSSAQIAAREREVTGDGARSPVAVVKASAVPRAYLGHLLQTRAGVRYATGIDFTERVRSGYPGSAHRRVRARPSGDVRGETASAITLRARGRRSRGAGFGPRVTPKAMTSPRTSLHFSSRFNQVDPTQRRAVRAAYVHLVTHSRVWFLSVRSFGLQC